MSALFRGSRVVAAVATSLTLVSLSSTVANAQIKDGTPCASEGKVVTVGTGKSKTDYVCKNEGKKKVWRAAKPTSGGTKSPGTSGVTITKGPVLSVAPFKASALDCADRGPTPIPASCFRPYGFSFKKESGETKILPSNQYILAPNTDVVAVTDADMVIVEPQPDSNDYEVLLIVFTNDKNAIWKIAYDHLDKVSVKAGSKVKAGQKIGVKTTSTDFELQVNQVRDQRGSKGNFYVCPKTLGSSAFNKFHDDALSKSNSAFPQFAVDSVCLKPAIAESDYKG